MFTIGDVMDKLIRVKRSTYNKLKRLKANLLAEGKNATFDEVIRELLKAKGVLRR